MSLFRKTPGSFAFIGNPMIVQVGDDINENLLYYLRVTIYNYDSSVLLQWTGSSQQYANSYAEWDIAGLFLDIIKNKRKASTGVINELEQCAYYYEMETYAFESATEEATGIALIGGIGPVTFGNFNALGLSYPAQRYMGNLGNYFATTRTVSDTIIIRDTEIELLSGFTPNGSVNLKVNFADGNTASYTNSIGFASFFSVDLQKIISDYGGLPELLPFDIKLSVNDMKPVTVRIVKSEPYRINRSLVFLNSLGAWERIQLTGQLDDGSEIDSEDSAFEQYIGSGMFEEARQRLSEREYLEGSVGWKTADELRFVKDMLKSDKIILDIDGIERNVLVEATGDIITRRDIPVPGSLDIRCKLTQDNKYVEDYWQQAAVTAAWASFLCNLSNPYGVWENTGEASATKIYVYRKIMGQTISGYPKSYSLLETFTVTNVNYPTITDNTWQQMASDQQAIRRNAFLTYVGNTEQVNVSDKILNNPVKTDISSCPVPAARDITLNDATALNLQIAHNAKEFTVLLKSTYPWKASNIPPWVSLIPAAGTDGIFTLRFKPLANTDEDDRPAIIPFTQQVAGGKTAMLNLNQLGIPAWILKNGTWNNHTGIWDDNANWPGELPNMLLNGEKEIEIAISGTDTNATIALNANYPWRAEKENKWISGITPPSGNSGDLDLSLAFPGNNNVLTARKETITVKSVDGPASASAYARLTQYGAFDGLGTQDEPYRISTPADLALINNFLSDITPETCFKVVQSLDLSDYTSWVPIGSQANPFRSKVDGNFKHIANLNILSGNSYSGLFGFIENCELNNIWLTGKNTLQPSSVQRHSVLCGYAKSAIINKVFVEGDFIANNKPLNTCGLLIGFSDGCLIQYCAVRGTMNTNQAVQISGGLIGNLYSLTPGVAGTYSTVKNCFSDVNIKSTYTGAGHTQAGAFIGGVGYAGPTERNIIENCYSTGSLELASEASNSGAMMGYYGAIVPANCYFDSEISIYPTDTKATSKTTDEMKMQSTFSGWDFNPATGIWTMDTADTILAGYPGLQWLIEKGIL